MAIDIILRRSATASKRPDIATIQYGELALDYNNSDGGLYYKSSVNTIIKVGSAFVGTSAPNATPAGSSGNSLGEFWLDTTGDVLKIWNGATWTSISGGGITSITAGAGLTGGTITTSGTIALDTAYIIQPSILTAKGSILAATAASTPADFATGIDGQVLMADSACAIGLKWSTVGGTGTVTQVTAGTGLTGGSITSSGTIALNTACVIQPSILTTKGSLISASAASTPTALSVGTDGQVLTADVTCFSGLKWAAPATSGTVTCIATGAGLTGGDITSTGTIALDTSGVSAGSYTYSAFTVDTYGRITAASNGAAPLPLTGGTMTGDITFAGTQTFPVSGIADATTLDKGIVSVGSNIQVSSGTISVASASTTQTGIVQLNNTTNSTSTTEALTAAQGKNLQDQIDAIAVTSNITLGGTFDANTGFVDSVTTAGTAAGLTVGSALPAAAPANNGVFVIIDVQGSTGPSGTPPYHIGDWFLSDGAAWQFLNVGFQAGQATTVSQGVVQLATDAEVQAGTDSSDAVVSSSLQSKLSDSVSTSSSTTIASSSAVKSAYDLAVSKVEGVTGTTPISVNNTDPKNPVVSVDAGSTLVSGVVQLTDSIGSTSTTTAATPSSVKTAYDLAGAALPCSAFTAKGDLVAGTGISTITALPVGTDGQVLIADSACTSGLKWGTGGGGGGGTGTVTSITAGTGLTGGTITTSGTIALDYATVDEVNGVFNSVTGTIGCSTGITLNCAANIPNGYYLCGPGLSPDTQVVSGGGTSSLTLSRPLISAMFGTGVRAWSPDNPVNPAQVSPVSARATLNLLLVSGSGGSNNSTPFGTSTVSRDAGNPYALVTTQRNHGLLTGHYVFIVNTSLSGVVLSQSRTVEVTGPTTFLIPTAASTVQASTAITFSTINIINSYNIHSVPGTISAGSQWGGSSGQWALNFAVALNAPYIPVISAYTATTQGASRVSIATPNSFNPVGLLFTTYDGTTTGARSNPQHIAALIF